MKLKFVLVFGLMSFFNFAQEISVQLPVLSPQSPTTSDLGKYGEVQVNESTGILSPSIPLFDFYAGNINIPIVLNYNGNGVKVNQDPSWTGINWSLNPGGVITRQVKDLADELTLDTSKKYLSSQELNSLPGYTTPADHNTTWWNTLKNLSNNNVDTEADIFNYNFLGYSGSFYLDKNLQTNPKAHLIKYDKELTITFIPASGLPSNGNNKSGFMIQTPNGDVYFFGGTNASESSRTYTNTGAGSTTNIPFTQNAFYLYKISFLNGGYVDFEYTQNGGNLNYCSNKIGIQESAKKLAPSNSACIIASPRDMFSQVENSITLKKIKSSFNSGQYVEFDTSTINQCAGIFKLNTISLKKTVSTGNEIILKKINLNYLIVDKETDYSRNKFFLEKVDFFNKNNQFEHDYELTYNSPELLPKKDSFAQDELGYYNGKNSNTTLLPLTSNTALNNSCFALADREADFNSSKIGSLSQIKYPTGGNSTFEYELPFKEKKQLYANHYIAAYYSDPTRNFNSSFHTYNSSTSLHSYTNTYYPDAGDGGVVINSTTSITIELNIAAMGAFTQQNNVLISAIRMTDNTIVWTNSTGYPLLTSTNSLNNYTQRYTFDLNPGTYIFKVAVNMHQSVCTCQTSSQSHPVDSNNYVVANVQMSLPAGFRNIYNPGLRIKKILTYDSNSNVNISRYYYNTLLNRNVESYVFNTNYYYKTREKSGSNFVDAYNLATNSLKNVFNSDSGNTYEFVTVSYGGDNFENGGKEMTFYKTSNYSPYHYATTADDLFNAISEFEFESSGEYLNFVDVGTNDSYQNSVLKKETLFDKNLKSIKESNYTYNGTIDSSIDNIKLYTFSPSTNGIIYLLYQTKSFKYRLISTDTKDFFSGSTEISNKTIQTFATDKVSLPSTIETTSSQNKANKTVVYYPSDIAKITNLSSDDATNIPLLTSKHNLAEIIKIERFSEDVLSETKQVSFKNWSGNILPNIIRIKKGNDPALLLENKINFHDYNFYGKPLIVSMEGGVKTQYVYNNKQQVVLKIDNLDSIISINDDLTLFSDCYYQNLYPDSMVTTYNYDDNTNSLISVIDPKCDKITYTYDPYGRLESIKDKNGNILSETLYHYKQ